MEVTTSIRGDISTVTSTIQAAIPVAETLALSNSMAQVKLATSDQADLSLPHSTTDIL